MPLAAPSFSRALVQDPLVTRRPLDVMRTIELESESERQHIVWCSYSADYGCMSLSSSTCIFCWSLRYDSVIKVTRSLLPWLLWTAEGQLLTRPSVRWYSCRSVPGCPVGWSSWSLCSPPTSHHAHQLQSAAPRPLLGTTSYRSPVTRESGSHTAVLTALHTSVISLTQRNRHQIAGIIQNIYRTYVKWKMVFLKENHFHVWTGL